MSDKGVTQGIGLVHIGDGKWTSVTMIPVIAKTNGATIIEINPEPSEYTRDTTDVFIQEKACMAVEKLMEAIDEMERE